MISITRSCTNVNYGFVFQFCTHVPPLFAVDSTFPCTVSVKIGIVAASACLSRQLWLTTRPKNRVDKSGCVCCHCCLCWLLLPQNSTEQDSILAASRLGVEKNWHHGFSAYSPSPADQARPGADPCTERYHACRHKLPLEPKESRHCRLFSTKPRLHIESGLP